MFTWLNKQGVKSSDGFILQRVHRFYYFFEKGDKKMQVYVEPGVPCEGVYKDSFDKWMPPHENIVISDEEKESIKMNVSDALNFMGVSFKFIKG